MGLENLARSFKSYLLVVDGEEAEHGSEHGAGGHKVAQTADMVRDEIPANKRGKLHLQSTVTQWDNEIFLQPQTKALKLVGSCLNGEGCYMCLYSGTPGERPPLFKTTSLKPFPSCL